MIIAIASTAREAVALVASKSFDMALLDINLGSETSIPVAITLRQKGVPFAFMSGYSGNNALPPAFRSNVVVGKPYDKDFLQSRIAFLGSTRG